MFLKIENHNGYDDFYIPLTRRDKTWNTILQHIESALDDKYVANEDSLVGVKLTIEIVKEVPADTEWQDAK